MRNTTTSKLWCASHGTVGHSKAMYLSTSMLVSWGQSLAQLGSEPSFMPCAGPVVLFVAWRNKRASCSPASAVFYVHPLRCAGSASTCSLLHLLLTKWGGGHCCYRVIGLAP